MKKSVTDRIEQLGVFPIIVIDNPADVEPLGEALLGGGLPCVEVTFRTPAAAEAIATFSSKFPEMLIGAGTVLSVDQVKQALDAGATYILAPGYNPTVVDFCLENQVSIYPGVCTPTEIDTALCRGLTVLKFFPAEAMGGLNYLKAISAPLAKARYLPTGGVNLQNLPDYLRFEKVLACAGTWIAKKDLIAERRFDRIRAEAEKAVQVVQEIRKPTRSS